MSREVDSRKDLQSTKFERRPQIKKTLTLKLKFFLFEAFVRILLIANLSLNQPLLTFLLCVRQSFRELRDSNLSGLHAFDNMAIIH